MDWLCWDGLILVVYGICLCEFDFGAWVIGLVNSGFLYLCDCGLLQLHSVLVSVLGVVDCGLVCML